MKKNLVNKYWLTYSSYDTEEITYHLENDYTYRAGLNHKRV